MTPIKRYPLAAMLAAAIVLSTSGYAQYRVVEPDGIAASPKTRQALNEHALARVIASAPKNTAVSVLKMRPHYSIAASPKVEQSLKETRHAQSPGLAESQVLSASAGYQPTGPDNITASPKARQQINERPVRVMVAPVK